MSNGFQAGVVLGLIDRPLDRRVQEALDGRVEPIQRNENTDFLLGDLLCRRLEGIEDRTARPGRDAGPSPRPCGSARRLFWTSWNWYGANG